MNDHSEKFHNLLMPVLSAVLRLILGVILMATLDFQLVQGYSSMPDVALGSQRGIGETLRQATPLIFTTLGLSVVNSAGFFSIGLSGQALCEWIIGVQMALAFPDLPEVVLLLLCVTLGTLAGAMAAAIPESLQTFFGTSEVIVAIMTSYILLYVNTFALHEVMSGSRRSSLDFSDMVSQNASPWLPWLTQAFGGSRVNSGLSLATTALIFVWLLMKKMTLGFEIRFVGLDPSASEYARMSSKRTIVLSMVVSGALAGLDGVVKELGMYQNFSTQTTSLFIGFDGMTASLLGSGPAVGVLLSAILFSILKIDELNMQAGTGVPFKIVNVSTTLIIFFVGISFLIHFVMVKFFRGKKQEEIVVAIEAKPAN